MTVLRDLMNSRVVAAAPSTTVAEAAAVMVKANVGSAVVTQGPFLVGILTERDVLRAAASGQDPSASLVSAWMTPDPQSAHPDTTVEEATQIMLLNGFRHLPIVEGREVCGVVSLRDLFASGIRRPLAGLSSQTGTAFPASLGSLVARDIYLGTNARSLRLVRLAKRLQSGRLDAYLGYMVMALLAVVTAVY